MDINELKARFAEFIKQARAIHDKAGDEKRSFTDEENVEFEKLMDEASALETTIEREDKIARAAQRYVGAPAGTVTKQSPDDSGEVRSGMPFDNFGEFLQSVRNADLQGRTGKSIDHRLIQVQEETRAITGMSETVASDGGFLVQQDFVTELLKKTHDVGVLYGKTRKIPVSANSNGIKINAIAESSRTDGNRWGGVRAYWEAEAGEKTKSKPKMRQMELNLRKLIGLCYATDELLQDAAALGSVLTQAFAEEFAFKLDDAILNGTGAGQPLGILTGAGHVTVAKETGQLVKTIVYDNIIKMWARLAPRSMPVAEWYINQDCLPELFNMGLVVGTGGTPAFMPAGGLSGSPFNTLFGRPVIPIEFCQTLGTKGDILLLDLNEYLTIDKGGLKADTSIHVRFIYDETAFRFVLRVDGQPIWNTALTPYKGTNTVSPYVALATRA